MPQYKDFVKETRYGYVDGLKGANCRHDFSGVFDWQKPIYTAEQLADIEKEEAVKRPFTAKDRAGNEITKKYTRFEATQVQRNMESRMRATRANAAGFKAGGADDAYREARTLYRAQRAEYERFSEAMELQPQWNRVYVDGLGRI